MHESFTDRARKVMQLAQQDALRSQVEYVGTGQILLALQAEGKGVAAKVLRRLRVDPAQLRQAVAELTSPGRRPISMGDLQVTPRALKVVELAMYEARALHHFYIGTEHLLLGLLGVEDGVAMQALTQLGLDAPRLREEVLQVLGVGHSSRPRRAAPTHGPARVQEDNVPPDVLEQIQDVDEQIAELARQKEQAVFEMRFEQAAVMRDAMDRLSRRRRRLLHGARTRPLHVVEFELVVPLVRHDGTLLDEEMLAWIRQKLHAFFGSCVYGILHVDGTWLVGTTELHGDLGVFRVLVEEDKQPRAFFAAFKQELRDAPLCLEEAAVLERKVDAV